MLTDNKLRNTATAFAIFFNTNFHVAYFTPSRLFHNNSVVSLVFPMGRLKKKNYVPERQSKQRSIFPFIHFVYTFIRNVFLMK